MRFETAYTLSLFSRLPERMIPFRLELDGIIFEVREQEEDWRRTTAYVNGPVNSENLIVRTGTRPLGGGEPSRGIEVPERAIFARVLRKAVNTLSFITDVPVRYAHKLEYDRLIPETPEDQKRLEDLGTDNLFLPIHGDLYTRSFSDANLSDQVLIQLASKELGLELYSNAILMQEQYAIFREFWKILESAFGTKDRQLLGLLIEYPPVQELGFTEDELKLLWVLRGRASHAESRKGMIEFNNVVSEINRTFHRLKCLVEQVILTKKDWGSTSCEVERLAKVRTIVDKNGKLAIFKGTDYDVSIN